MSGWLVVYAHVFTRVSVVIGTPVSASLRAVDVYQVSMLHLLLVFDHSEVVVRDIIDRIELVVLDISYTAGNDDVRRS